MRLKTLASVSVLGSLMGCSTLLPGTQPAAPVAVVKDGVPSQVHAAPKLKATVTMAEGLYALARQAHASGQLSAAAQGYERVLSLQPEHVGALNALGVIRAQDGRGDEALDLFARALKQEPTAAHIHNNLGYALLREERLDEAQAALKLALDLRPDSAQTLKNLELLAEARARQEAAQPSMPTLAAAPQPAEPAPAPAEPAIVAVAPSVFELRLSTQLSGVGQNQAATATAEAAPVVQPQVPLLEQAPVETAAVVPAGDMEPGYKLVLSREMALQTGPFAIWTDIRGAKLEVSNGVGITRLAKRTAVRLAASGVATTRVTNDRPYRQARTQIQYLPGQKAAVQALAAQLPVPVELVPVGQLNARVNIRLVLGHDVAGQAIAAWLDGSGSHFAAQPVTGPRAS